MPCVDTVRDMCTYGAEESVAWATDRNKPDYRIDLNRISRSKLDFQRNSVTARRGSIWNFNSVGSYSAQSYVSVTSLHQLHIYI